MMSSPPVNGPSFAGQSSRAVASDNGAGRPVARGGIAERIAHAALRGAIAAMAMTGMRALTISLGIVEESPPQAIVRQRARLLIRRVPRGRRRATVELFHWGYGATGGALFTMLPAALRRRAWAGPIYGLLTWAGFETAIAPALGLSQAKKRRAAERAALAVDHLLYGLVLSEMRQQPRE